MYTWGQNEIFWRNCGCTLTVELTGKNGILVKRIFSNNMVSDYDYMISNRTAKTILPRFLSYGYISLKLRFLYIQRS